MPTDLTKLEDAISKGQELGAEIDRGVLTTKRGLRIRVARKGLAQARMHVNPNDEKYRDREDVKGNMKWTIAGLPRNVTKDTLTTVFDKLKWKAVVGRSIPDKFDENKLFWHAQSDTEPLQYTYNVKFPDSNANYTIIINKQGTDETEENTQISTELKTCSKKTNTLPQSMLPKVFLVNKPPNKSMYQRSSNPKYMSTRKTPTRT